MKKSSIIAAATLLAIAILYLTLGGGSYGKPQEAVSENFRLGTYVKLRLIGDDKKFLDKELAAADAEIISLEGLFSVNIASSDVSRVNGADGEWVEVDSKTAALVKHSLEIAARTDGAFDPTLGQVAVLWGIGTSSARVPSKAEIRAALRGSGYEKVMVKESGGMWHIKTAPGLWLDLGAIAKGYVSDILKNKLTADGVTQAMIDLGGNLDLIGSSQNGRPWRLGLQHPKKPRGEYFGVVELSDSSVVTSGVYERFFEKDGVRYHHIFDPTTGYPAKSDFASVSIINRDSALADALCTALFVMGRAKAEKFLAENGGLAAVFVTASGEDVLVTPAARKIFKLTDKNFNLKEIAGGGASGKRIRMLAPGGSFECSLARTGGGASGKRIRMLAPGGSFECSLARTGGGAK